MTVCQKVPCVLIYYSLEIWHNVVFSRCWSLCASSPFDQFVKRLPVNFSPLLTHLLHWQMDVLPRLNAVSHKHVRCSFAASWINLPAAALIKSLICWFWDATLACTAARRRRATWRGPPWLSVTDDLSVCGLCSRQSSCRPPTISYQAKKGLRSDDAHASQPRSLWAPADGKAFNY